MAGLLGLAGMWRRNASHTTDGDRVSTPEEDGSRVVRVAAHGQSSTSRFCDNSIITSKYNVVNIVPKALFEQFRRLSNFYFLAIAVVSFIGSISPVSPATTVLPLVVVVGFGLLRDVWEDFARKRQDRAANNAPVSVLSGLGADVSKISLEKRQTRSLRVGDVVCVRANEVFPADLLLLQSTGESGVAYCSTANLDGESSLKRKLVHQAFYELAPNNSQTLYRDLPVNTLAVRASRPDPALLEFSASFVLDDTEQSPRFYPLDEKNLLLRGSVLRNTDHIYGLVLYTGDETKVALNMRDPPSKLGQIELMMNRIVIVMFLALLIVTLVMAGLGSAWQGSRGEDQWYMGSFAFESAGTAFVKRWGTFVILFHTFIPISMFVTLEFVRVIQGIFIAADVKMRSRGIRVTPKAGNLHEVLGNIEHILSDKTGTLTQNVMRFVACSAGDVLYDIRTSADSLRSAVRGQSYSSPAYQLVQAMALTHSVVPEVVRDSVTDSPYVEYHGQSPDEVALVDAARDFGVRLEERKLDRTSIVTLDKPQGLETYTVLAELEFSSERKRMSVVLEHAVTKQIFIFTKGADAVMFDLLAPGDYRYFLERHILTFAESGLRTLVFGKRQLNRGTFAKWYERWFRASAMVEGRSLKQAELAAELEVDLEYVGCTAVEDKLQDKVPETIKFFREAGVRLWVLTGDKLETAENIGYSSNLLSREMQVEIINATTANEMDMQLRYLLRGGSDRQPSLSGKEHHRSASSSSAFERIASLRSRSLSGLQARDTSMIVDGRSFALLGEDENLQQMFMDVSDHCKTVICARVTPAQKAKVVQMVRRWRNAITLAIGDGGNDVSMIQEAHIGVGLIGKEGSQAALAADYSMAEFRHLQRLLSVHGRFSYIRSAGVINLSFYKNILFTTTQIIFQFFAFASGTTLHDQWVITSYNALITLAGPFLYGIFERDLEGTTLGQYPSVYLCNRNNRLFSYRTVAEHTLAYSVWHALVCFFGVYFLFARPQEIALSSGRDPGFYAAGLACSIVVVGTVQFKFLMSSHILNKIILAFIVISFGLVFALIPLFISLFHEHELEGVQSVLLSSNRFHLVWPVVFVVAFIPDFVVKMYRTGVLGRYKKNQLVTDLQQWETEDRKDRRRTSRRDHTVLASAKPFRALNRRKHSSVTGVDV